MKLTLYTGPQCSLCDLAEEVVSSLNTQGFLINIDKVNIRDSVDLYHVYGARIPVLKRHDNGAELGWPFGDSDLIDFIK